MNCLCLIWALGVFDHNILKNKLFCAIWGDILTRKCQMNATNGQPKMMHRSSSRTGHLSTRLKTHSEEKSEKCNQCYLYPIRQAIWGDVFKDSVEKSQTNGTSVIIHLLVHTIWRHIWKHTMEKLNKWNQCGFASSRENNLIRKVKQMLAMWLCIWRCN